MNGKFKNLPVEEDTTILLSIETKLDAYDVVYQKWYWEGIHGECVIFYTPDVEQLDEAAIKKEVRENTALVNEGSQLTYKKGDTDTFVNFNFKYN